MLSIDQITTHYPAVAVFYIMPPEYWKKHPKERKIENEAPSETTMRRNVIIEQSDGVTEDGKVWRLAVMDIKSKLSDGYDPWQSVEQFNSTAPFKIIHIYDEIYAHVTYSSAFFSIKEDSVVADKIDPSTRAKREISLLYRESGERGWNELAKVVKRINHPLEFLLPERYMGNLQMKTLLWWVL